MTPIEQIRALRKETRWLPTVGEIEIRALADQIESVQRDIAAARSEAEPLLYARLQRLEERKAKLEREEYGHGRHWGLV